MLIKNKGGFSILEVLLVLFLFGIIFAMSAGAYNSWQRQVVLINAKDEIKSALVRAHQLSSAVAKDNTWGIHLETNRYILFKGNYYNEIDPDNVVWDLRGVTILNPEESFADGAGSYGSDVVFAKLTGSTSNYGTISVASLGDVSSIKSIDVQASGQIN